MSIVARLLLVVPLQILGLSWAIADGFTFADMSLKTSAEQLRHRYPASTMVGNYLYVAPGDPRITSTAFNFRAAKLRIHSSYSLSTLLLRLLPVLLNIRAAAT